MMVGPLACCLLTATTASYFLPRAPAPVMLARVRAADLKKRLAAAGVDTSNVFEKDELQRLVDALGPESAPSSYSLPITFMRDAAYAELDAGDSAILRLLIDTGASTSILSSSAAATVGVSGQTRATLRSRSQPSLALSLGVASPQQMLPDGVDGILGLDAMRQHAAAELDFSAATLRLHAESVELSSAVALPTSLRPVAAGTLPFVRCAFGDAEVDGLIDTGSPVTMATPELASAGKMVPRPDESADIITTGVDGMPTRMRASTCSRVALLGDGQCVSHEAMTCYAGTCPMMVMSGVYL